MGLFSKSEDNKNKFHASLLTVSSEQVKLIKDIFNSNMEEQLIRESERDSKQYEYTDSLISDEYEREHSRLTAQLERENEIVTKQIEREIAREKAQIEREDAREEARVLRDSVIVDLLNKILDKKEESGFKFFGK